MRLSQESVPPDDRDGAAGRVGVYFDTRLKERLAEGQVYSIPCTLQGE
jgi:hypothetical protein